MILSYLLVLHLIVFGAFDELTSLLAPAKVSHYHIAYDLWSLMTSLTVTPNVIELAPQ